jgi:mannose-1-phosphate guanylyltransferase/phosphomannomutase
MPLARFTVRSEQASGGISVRTSPNDPEDVEIRLFDSDGADLSEADQRKIERIFYREDYRRTGAAKLGVLEFPPHASEQYVLGLLRAIDLEAIREKAPDLKAVIDYAYGPISLIGPAIMGRIGCDVLGVHAYTDESRPVLRQEDVQKMVEDLRDHVRKSGSDLGVLIEPGGEIAHLVDDRGRSISHERALLAFLRHEASRGIETAAVPIACSSACEAILEGTSTTVQRTPVGLASMMAHSARRKAGFAGNSEGALIFPSFMPAPDALMTFCKTLELIAHANRPLSEAIDDLPEVHVAKRDVETPWNMKGAVMRRLAADASGRLVLIDGVKVVEDDSWALVIPYPDAPLCGVWAEAQSADQAEELADEYVRRVEKVVASGPEETYL